MYLCRMKTELKENGGLPAHILWTLAIVAGVSVANLYYNQPLLNVIRHELGVSEFKTNLIAMITQVGYAIGLLFIVPLGDLYQRKKIILTNFTLLIFSLIAIYLLTKMGMQWFFKTVLLAYSGRTVQVLHLIPFHPILIGTCYSNM